MDSHLKSLQQKYRESLKRNEFQPQLKVAFSDSNDGEDVESPHEFPKKYAETQRPPARKSSVYNLQAFRDELEEIPRTRNPVNHAGGGEYNEWEEEEEDDYSGKKAQGSIEDNPFRNPDLKSSWVNPPNALRNPNPPSSHHPQLTKAKPAQPKDQLLLSSKRMTPMDPQYGNVHSKLKAQSKTPELLSRFNSKTQPVRLSTSKSQSWTNTIPSSSPNKGLISMSKLKPGLRKGPEDGIFSDLPSVGNPEQELANGLRALSSSDWERNVGGFRTLVALLRNFPEYMGSQPEELHNVNMAGIKHIPNLRSQVSRAACSFFQEMFSELGPLMEPDVEKIGQKLLDRSADTNKFIRDSSSGALEAMVQNLSPAQTIVPLENFGAKHRNNAVKTATAKLLGALIKKLGPEKCLTSTQMGKKILGMLVQFLQEGSLETRKHGKAGMLILMGHGYFEKALRNNVPPQTLQHLTKTIEGIKKEFLGNKGSI